MGKRSLIRNEEFRKKSLRGAKVEDLLHYIRKQINEILDRPETPESRAVLEALEDLEKYIIIKFDYQEVKKMTNKAELTKEPNFVLVGQGGDEWFLENREEASEGELIEGTFYRTNPNEYRTGWFQDSDSGCWIRVIDGRTSGSWREDEPDWEEYL